MKLAINQFVTATCRLDCGVCVVYGQPPPPYNPVYYTSKHSPRYITITGFRWQEKSRPAYWLMVMLVLACAFRWFTTPWV